MLDRKKHGFISEAVYYGSKYDDPQDKYVQFWFSSNHDVETVFSISKMVIGLHNSWTPKWYKRLSEKEVLAQDCLLSKTIKHILAE